MRILNQLLHIFVPYKPKSSVLDDDLWNRSVRLHADIDRLILEIQQLRDEKNDNNR